MSGLWIYFGSRTSAFAGFDGRDERHEGKRGVEEDSKGLGPNNWKKRVAMFQDEESCGRSRLGLKSRALFWNIYV